MNRWKITGLMATVVIILSVPLYLAKTAYIDSQIGGIQPASTNAFVGTLKCRECHQKQYDDWQDSHHDHAMAKADPKSVLGDFNDIEVTFHGVTSRFYQRDGRYFTYTQGIDGQMGEYEITHTFGWHPLQQYLVPFPGGRLQCLPIAWDVREKRWYHLNPDEPLIPQDWLYWTNAGQNWNGMCAECHSTNLKKNYDIQKDTFETTCSEINVGCEACHGPGSRHVEWAELPDMARPQVENDALVVKTSELKSRELVELCAPCHSRRAILGDYTHAEPDLLDSMLPSLLTPELYFPDGQILEEVYVYGSFTQSKMYHRDVRCSDCHDVHSVRLIKEDNALCLQCHRAKEYDSKDHHFHKKADEEGEPILSAEGEILFDVGTGAECVQCHMPGRTYMGIDYRPDHSFRVPRPDLTLKINSPNACNRCHIDKDVEWSDDAISKWYGPGRRRHFGPVLAAGRESDTDVHQDLITLSIDPLYPVIVRATALSLLSAYTHEETTRAYELALMDDEALIRRTALESLNILDPKQLAKLIAPLLYDEVKAVRTQAAARLAGEPAKHLDTNQRKVFQSALKEFIASMAYSGDFSFGRYNLGNLYVALNQPQDAIEHYRAANRIDNLFYPAKVNLAMLHNEMGKQEEAEKLFREVVREHPELYEAAYSLGLLLAEREKYLEAVEFLRRASEGIPNRARVHYNLGLLLQQLKQDTEAEAPLKRAHEIERDHFDYLYALTDFYLKRDKLEEAKYYAEQLAAKHPDQQIVPELLSYIEKNL